MKLTIALLALVASTFGGPAVAEVGRHTCARWLDTFFTKPHAEKLAQFASYDLDTQYTVYLCANQYFEPPVLDLAEPFASEGQKAAMFLKHKLAARVDDLTVRDIARVFVEMRRQHTYDVNGNPELVSLLSDKVRSMSNAYWREYTENMLLRLKAE